MKEITLKKRLSSGEVEFIALKHSESPPWKITFQGSDYVADDLFNSLLELRKELELKGECLLCNGSRKDCYPSGMSRQMSGGVVVYKYLIGRHVDPNETFNIFDETSYENLSTVEEQKEYFYRWVKSEKK